MSIPILTPPTLSSLLRVDAVRPAVRGALALTLVLIASSCVQVSAVLSRTLFDHLSPLGVSGLRFAIAAIIMLSITRPQIRGRSVRAWGALVLYGLAIAAMNLFMYQSLTFLPLGVAITLEFLGPFAVAMIASRKPRQAFFALLGLIGVVLIARPSVEFEPVGIVFGCLAAIALGSYVIVAERVAARGGGASELALAFTIAALATSPFALAALPAVQVADAPVLAASAVLGCVVAFSADFLAVRITGARTVAILLSLDPVLAAMIGTIALGEHLDALTMLGMLCVSAAGGLAAFSNDAQEHAKPPLTPATSESSTT